MISITQQVSPGYPKDLDFYSPSERYPEYPYDLVSAEGGGVYDQVRRTFAQAGLDGLNFGKKNWNPLGSWIRPGQKVFILCNFVQERRVNQSLSELQAKCSHGSVLRALCDYVLIALKGQGEVLFGNAPLQSTDWNRVLSETGAASVAAFYRERKLPVRAVDLRLAKRPRSVLGHVTTEVQEEGSTACVEVDLTETSLLQDLQIEPSLPRPRFRVMDYDYRLTERFQSFGKHIYLVRREILESDVVISLPKLKTHEKVGITCALKGFVGIVGHKHCLAHHRFGSAEEGGDEYPAHSSWRRAQSKLHETVSAGPMVGVMKRIGMILDRNIMRLLSRTGSIYGGAWHGNDTCWRMALDLARIAHFATPLGIMNSATQRSHLCLVDGIIGGEGKGPLSPKPVRAGVLIFGDSVVLSDLAACQLMGYDSGRIPLIRESLTSDGPHSLVTDKVEDTVVVYNGERIGLNEVQPVLGRAFQPSPGWRTWLRPANERPAPINDARTSD